MDQENQDDKWVLDKGTEKDQLENPRIRQLTERGKEQYELNVYNFTKDLRRVSLTIDEQIHSFVNQEDNKVTTESTIRLKNDLEQNNKNYQTISREFLEYLDRSRCRESIQEISAHKLVSKTLSEKVQYAISIIDETLSKCTGSQKEPAQRDKITSSQHNSSRSHRSYASNSSHGSRQSSYLRQKMKSEAAKCRLEFAEQEAKLQLEKSKIEEEECITAMKHARQKKNLEIDINLLAAKRDAMEAQAELQVIDEEFNSETGSTSSRSSVKLASEKLHRTKQYIIQQSSLSSSAQKIETVIEKEKENNTNELITKEKNNFLEYNHPQEPELVENTTKYSVENNIDVAMVTVSKSSEKQEVLETGETDIAQEILIDSSNISSALQVTTNPVLQQETNPQSFSCPVSNTETRRDAAIDYNNNANLNAATEFARLFMKKELLLSRLTSFTDNPENYLIWKASFRSIMHDLQVTPSEEMDLLIRWLGQESSKQAIRLRASNTHDPKKGLERIWNRLDERYGSPELIESTLKDKILKFGKMNNTDNKRLYELGDLLAEIDSVKEDPKYSTLLGYFDSSSGVNPIVSKLPHFLQTKWTDRAVRYKLEKHVVYPPFKVFVYFIQEMSTRLNDPSFNYDKNPTGNNDKQGQYNRPRNYNSVSTKKTEVAQKSGNTWKRETKFGCPLHEQSNHSLNECKQFRRKPIDERKTIIMQNGICFKCCNGKHLARNCNENQPCKQCQSKGHPDALHIEKGPNPTTGHGGEQNQSDGKPANKVTTACTQICGDSFKGRSCAKTVLVKVYPNGQPEKAIRVYAILDDQSNRTLATSQFFELFNINSQKIEYTLSSCAGSMVVSGRMACDFTVESFDGSMSLDLPPLIECNDIPNVREEIPTPNVAFFHDHLRSISSMIPPLDSDAQILLLIGRDLGEAHHVYDQRTGPQRTPYAQKLALGWVVIGETCLGKVHVPDKVNVNKTFVLQNGRTSICKPCTSDITIKEQNSIDFIECEGHTADSI
ncbi:uncharacterized protein LOC127724930 [Mytilus californianus]|uniref:uncharacterized protein LOC127724930 n=1 Tax=Mytilus californianus TaxID=6549 RepID=UPI00224635EB|nr:uncharacterized protein LOC127724930 [Mytilus californianus]